MRALFSVLLLLVSFTVVQAQDHGGFGGGNGGDPPASVFRSTGYAIADYLEANPIVYPEISRPRFRRAVGEVIINVEDRFRVMCPMTITDGVGTFTINEERCSCNYPARNTIQIGACFAAIDSDMARIQHVAHELIFFTGLSDRDEVRSQGIARHMARTSLFGIPDTGLGSAMSGSHDAEGRVTGHLAAGSVHLGVGGGVMVDGGRDGTVVGGSPMATLEAYGFIRGRRGDGDDRSIWPFMAASGEITAAIGMAADRPVYRVTVDLSGSLVPAVGLWFFVDAAQYAQRLADGTISTRDEQVWAGGVPLIVFPVSMGGHDFMSIRVNAGAGSVSAPGTDVAEPAATYAAAVSALIRTSSFFVHVTGTAHMGSAMSTPGRLEARAAVRAALAYTLGLLFPSDAIRLEGNVVGYSVHERPGLTHYELGLYYEMRF